jgi:hypothetical protein
VNSIADPPVQHGEPGVDRLRHLLAGDVDHLTDVVRKRVALRNDRRHGGLLRGPLSSRRAHTSLVLPVSSSPTLMEIAIVTGGSSARHGAGRDRALRHPSTAPSAASADAPASWTTTMASSSGAHKTLRLASLAQDRPFDSLRSLRTGGKILRHPAAERYAGSASESGPRPILGGLQAAALAQGAVQDVEARSRGELEDPIQVRKAPVADWMNHAAGR